MKKWHEVCELLSGFAFSSRQFCEQSDTGLPVIRIQNLGNDNREFVYWEGPYSEKYLVEPGDLLLSLSGSVKVDVWSGPPALLNQRIVKVIPKEGVDERWLYWSIQASIAEIANMGKKSIINNISVTELKELPMQVPDETEQRRVASLLDAASALLDKRKAQLDALEELTESLFQHLLFPGSVSLKRVLLGSIIRKTQNGISRRASDEEGRIVLKLKDIKENRIDTAEVNRILLTDSEREKYRVQPGDLLLVRVNGNPDYVGRCAPFAEADEDLYFNDHIIRIVPDSSVDVSYLSHYLNSRLGKREIRKNSKTSAGQYTISREGLDKIALVLPPLDKQRMFAEKTKRISDQRLLLKASLNELEATLAALIRQSFRSPSTE